MIYEFCYINTIASPPPPLLIYTKQCRHLLSDCSPAHSFDRAGKTSLIGQTLCRVVIHSREEPPVVREPPAGCSHSLMPLCSNGVISCVISFHQPAPPAAESQEEVKRLYGMASPLFLMAM